MAIALMIEAVCTKKHRSMSTKLQGAISHKAVILVLVAVRTWNFICGALE